MSDDQGRPAPFDPYAVRQGQAPLNPFPSQAPLYPPPIRAYPDPPQAVAGLGTAVQVFVGLTVVASVVAVPAILGQRSLLQRELDEPGSMTQTEAEAADSLVQSVQMAWLGLFAVAGILTVTWLYRARKNVDAFGRGHRQRRSPGWAIGGWICPVVNLWFPFQVVADVKADSQGPLSEPVHSREGLALVRWWWAFFLAATILSRVSVAVYDSALDLEGVLTSVNMDLVVEVSYVVAGLLFIGIVRTITAAQQARIAELSLVVR